MVALGFDVLDWSWVDLGPLLILARGPTSSTNVSAGIFSASGGLQEPFLSISDSTSNRWPILIHLETPKRRIVYVIEDQIKQHIIGIIVYFGFRWRLSTCCVLTVLGSQIWPFGFILEARFILGDINSGQERNQADCDTILLNFEKELKTHISEEVETSTQKRFSGAGGPWPSLMVGLWGPRAHWEPFFNSWLSVKKLPDLLKT